MVQDNAEFFNNREWSWLAFNNRVLYEAQEKENPILERVKFTAIVTSNLEEFFMVRVAGLKKQKEVDYKGSSYDGRTPAEQLIGIRERVRTLLAEQYENFYTEILPLLQKESVNLITVVDQLEEHREILHSVFENEIRPVITPISVGPTHPFPNLVTGRLYLAVSLEPNADREDQIEKSDLSFIEIPTKVSGRFYRLDTNTFIPMELIIKLFVGEMYNGYQVMDSGIIKCTRDTDFSIQEDAAGDLLTEIEQKIKQIHHRLVIKLEHEKGFPEKILDVLLKNNTAIVDDVYEIDGLLNLQDLFEFYASVDRPRLKSSPMPPVNRHEFEQPDIFSVLNNREFLLFHPYDAYDPIVTMINQAADDKYVLAIKQILYRTSSDSPIIKALVRAAENGKYVSVVVELKARFDEKRNIGWAKKLEDAGVHVIYGLAGLKTHGKALLIVRKESQGIRRYVHLATGNYNESTARLYTDLSFFTTDEHYGADVSQLYNLLTGFSYPGEWNHLAIAPLDLRKKFTTLIRRETENARKGMKGKIMAMMNSLADNEIVKLLYEASQAGVKIQLIVRGICILKPGMKGVSENISVTSIIGEFLQHARIYYFYNGGEEEFFLASADWMRRNLDGRIEILFPVRQKLETDFIKTMFKIQLNDTVNAWTLHPKGNYKRVTGKKDHNCFQEIYKYIKDREKAAESTNAAPIFKPVTSHREK